MKLLLSTFLAISAIFYANNSSAQVKDQAFEDWTVYTTNLQEKKTCYIASKPKGEEGNFSKRDTPYFLVTSINDKIDEVSTSAGYSYKKNGDVKLNIDGQKFTLFSEGEIAWANSSEKDASIVEKMKSGKKLSVRGTSIKGTYSIDKYSLKGFTTAYKRMKSLCAE